jgi:23S rRNA U2552 (ribose-2'-O)-methylase RlmE/FtsJ
MKRSDTSVPLSASSRPAKKPKTQSTQPVTQDRIGQLLLHRHESNYSIYSKLLSHIKDASQLQQYHSAQSLLQKVFPFAKSRDPLALDEILSSPTFDISNRWASVINLLNSALGKLNMQELDESDVCSFIDQQHCINTIQWGQIVDDLFGHSQTPCRIRMIAQPELCTYAWCQAWELYHTYRDEIFQIDDNTTSFSSLHLSEAPGSFITSLNHFVFTKFKGRILLDWMAVSLPEGCNPYMYVVDKAFIRETSDRWINTINLVDQKSIKNIILSTGKVDLVTANAGVKLTDILNVEDSIFQVKLSEIVTALHVLKPGGTLIIKFYTLFQENSVGLLRILLDQFSIVHMVKPRTSNPFNCEVFLVCLNYTGTRQEILDKLLSAVGTESTNALVAQSGFDETFLSQVYSCNNYFVTMQAQTIECGLKLYKRLDNHRGMIQRFQIQAEDDFIAAYELIYLHFRRRIMYEYYDDGSDVEDRSRVQRMNM